MTALAPKVALGSLGQPATLAEALHTWSGFVQAEPGETSARPNLTLAPSAPVDPAAFLAEHGLTGPVQPIGCHFLQDVTVCGVLYPFLDGRLIDDGSHLSMVSADWLTRFPTHFPGRSGKPPLVLDAPVLPVAGPGYQTYGHWIIDFLPRIAVARAVLGDAFGTLKYLILHDTPDWAMRLMASFFGIQEADCYRLTFGADEVLCRRVLYPTYAHTYPFLVHSFLRRFYRLAHPPSSAFRRICVRRRTSPADGRPFAQRAAFEVEAVRRGYQLVDPLELTLAQQVSVFGTASVIIGEYGSALHNSVFSPSSTVVGVLNAPGVEQTRLCAAFGQPVVYMPSSSRAGPWTLTDAELASFFDAVATT